MGDAGKNAKRVAEIYEINPSEFLSKGKQQRRVRARSLFCFWAVREVGISLRELARQLEISPPAVGYCVQRGEAIARENGYRLVD
jgi:putative transposase